MAARLPLLHKTPFVLHEQTLQEATSPHAGLLSVSRVYRSLGVPDLIAANLRLRKRQRGFMEAQFVESIALLQAVGGECPEDMPLLGGDECLARGLGYHPPKATAVREFLERFHDKDLEKLRPEREVQKSFIFPSSQPVSALQAVQSGLVRRIAKLYEKQGQPQRIATVDQDATIIESHKQAAYYHYEEGRGYQPMVAVWAEADLVLADEYRDGNVPAKQDPLTCAKLAFAALPLSIRQRYFRGDSGCHENQLLDWLKHPDREKEPGGRIGFAVSAVMSEPLAEALRRVPERDWKTFGKEDDGTLRQWAEVDFVPGEEYECKDSQPLRYVGLRLLKPQGVLFGDGTDRHYHAVITNQKTEGGRLLDWHREKAGTVEHTHDEVKNELGGKHVPSQRFGVNSAWFKIALLTYNIVSAMKGLCLEGEERTARLKRFRLLLIHVAGRMNRNNCVMGLRLCNDAPALQRMQKVWKVFELPTQATSAKALGRRGS
ncbi:MAG: IS1380 family transposase [Acidobacteriia bacterium]|nr:IS1380 family transposase [Terriglobia bacterium]